MSLKFVIFFGSCREGRLGFPAALYMSNLLKARNHEVFLFDPEERQFPLLRKAYHSYSNPADVPSWLSEVREEVVKADALLVVSAEYNHSLPPALVNAMDHFPPDDYRYKPCGIVTYSYGAFGGARVAMQLRNLLGELGMVTAGTMFAIPKIHEAFDKEGVPQNDYMVKGGAKLIAEVEWYAQALKSHKEKNGKPAQ